MPELNGSVAPGFEPVAAAFAGNLRHEIGAAVSVVRRGETVVDLWGGAWSADTAVLTFSCTKSLLSACAAMLADSGELELDAPVARYWPEFSQAGKGSHSVRDLLSHRAGLVAPARDLTLDDLAAWDPVVDVLAAQSPGWALGTGFAYHPLTFGWLVGEVLRRISGLRPRELFRQLVAEPLDLDAGIGQRADWSTVATLVPDPPERNDPELAARDRAVFGADPVLRRAYTLGGVLEFPINGLGSRTNFNDPAIRSLDLAAVNGIGSARDLALLHAALVGGHGGRPLLGKAIRDDVLEPRSSGPALLGPPNASVWGTGFMLDSPGRALLGPRSFGHDGAGGCLTFADDEHELGFAYVANRMGVLPDERANRLVAALRSCLAT